jgi:hypothetical protein
VALEETEARELRLIDKVGESEKDGVSVSHFEPMEEKEGGFDSVPLPHSVELPDEKGESEGVELEQKLGDAVEHGVLEMDEVKQRLWVAQLDAEVQGLVVADEVEEYDCDGDVVVLCIVDTLRDTVDEIVGQAEAVVDGDKQPLCVADPKIEALTLLVKERDGDKVTEELDVNESETVEDCDRVNDEEEHTVLENDEDAQPLWVPVPDEEPQGLPVNDVVTERDCDGEDEELCVFVGLPVSVKEIDGLAEAVNERDEHPLSVELCVTVAQCETEKDIVGQAEAVNEEETQPLGVGLCVVVSL